MQKSGWFTIWFTFEYFPLILFQLLYDVIENKRYTYTQFLVILKTL